MIVSSVKFGSWFWPFSSGSTPAAKGTSLPPTEPDRVVIKRPVNRGQLLTLLKAGILPEVVDQFSHAFQTYETLKSTLSERIASVESYRGRAYLYAYLGIPPHSEDEEGNFLGKKLAKEFPTHTSDAYTLQQIAEADSHTSPSRANEVLLDALDDLANHLMLDGKKS